MKLRIPDHILKIAPYVPGKPIEALEREYGVTDSIKLASNENPLGPSPKAVEAVHNAADRLNRYPDGPGYTLLHRLAARFEIKPEQIVLGNGSDEILGMLALALLQPGDEVVVPSPSFLIYTMVTQSAGAIPVHVPLKELTIDLEALLGRVGSRTRLIFVCNPNNPTGTAVSEGSFESFLSALPPDVIVVVDEAYIDFVRDADSINGLRYLESQPPVVTLRTFSKAYGLAGLRIGFGVMPVELAEVLNRVRMPFNVNALAQAAAAAALTDQAFLERTVALVHEGLDFLYAELEKRGIRYFPSQANFFLVDVGRDAQQVFDSLLHKGVIVRPMAEYGFPHYIRINVGLPEENRRFLAALDDILTLGGRHASR